MEIKTRKTDGKSTKKSTKATASYASIRTPAELKKDAKKWRDFANKNKSGRKIKLHEILSIGVGLIAEKDIRELKEKSLTHKERLEILRQKYIGLHGPISEDDFLGFTMTPQFQDFLRQQELQALAA